jgi:hypothetical protein
MGTSLIGLTKMIIFMNPTGIMIWMIGEYTTNTISQNEESIGKIIK